ncbi:hypothetical protein ACFSHT_19780 [Paraburkholderia silviterrae]|nr:hypothetical protein [Paraburkholderia silviterrae]
MIIQPPAWLFQVRRRNIWQITTFDEPAAAVGEWIPVAQAAHDEPSAE